MTIVKGLGTGDWGLGKTPTALDGGDVEVRRQRLLRGVAFRSGGKEDADRGVAFLHGGGAEVVDEREEKV